MTRLSLLSKVLVLSLILVTGMNVYGQDPNAIDIKSIKVDELSDEQVRKFSDEIKKRGLSEQELELMASARGMSASEISKLKRRIKNLDRSGDVNRLTSDIERTRQNQILQDSVRSDFFNIIQDSTASLEMNKPRIFGMEFFNNPNLSFSPSNNIPTPENYVLGASDEIIIDIWGASEQNYQLELSPEGMIVIPNIGPISLSGLTIEQATKKINARLKRIYSGLGRNTFSQVSLGQIRSISVNIVGEVKRPGSYEMSSFASVLNALYYAQGPTRTGTMRAVEIIRSGKRLETVDIYDFLLGKVSSSVVLQDQDVILVKPYKSRVLFEGEVKRPAVYEMIEGETLANLLEISGGFKSEAYTESLTIRRIKGLKRSVKTVESDNYDRFLLKSGDEILVSEITERYENRVQISGAVNHEGEFELREGMTLKDLLVRAEGFREDAFVERGVILRLADDLSFTNKSFRPADVMNGEDGSIALQNGDYVSIQSIFDLKEREFVSIEGEVLKSGEYPYVENMTVEDIIFLAGGFKESATRSLVEVSRRLNPLEVSDPAQKSEIFTFSIDTDLKLSKASSVFKLSPYDVVIVRKSPNFHVQEVVEVEGEVNFPGKYTIKTKTDRISDLLERAGGPNGFAYLKGATLIRRTEYFEKKLEMTAENLKRTSLEKLALRDSVLKQNDFRLNKQESIGIRLEEIVKNPGSKFDLILEVGDVLSIPKKLETVRVRGELLYPTTTRFENGLGFKDYISQAGGFADRARKAKSYVVYANGSAARTKKFLWFKNYPKIEPGADIFVPQGPERRKLRATEVLAIGNVAVTLGWVFVQLFGALENGN